LLQRRYNVIGIICHSIGSGKKLASFRLKPRIIVNVYRENCPLMVGECCFHECRLPRTEAGAFGATGLGELIIPASVKGLGKVCLCGRISLSSVNSESRSRLSRIEAGIFGRIGPVIVVSVHFFRTIVDQFTFWPVYSARIFCRCG
jgi:hypothetical protein